MSAPLSPAERARYARQIALPGFGPAAQQRLRESTVLMIGVGGLGSPASLYLAAAGVGRIVILDGDRVEASNLHRQVLFAEDDVGSAKAETARDALLALNPHIAVEAYAERFDADNAARYVQDTDVVVDGTDTFATRYLVNDACAQFGVPNVFASVDQFSGQASVFSAPGGPCYRCLFPDPPPANSVPSCADGGVVGVLPGLLGLVQATETVKLLTGLGRPLVGRLLMVDALAMRFRELAVTADPACPACGTGSQTHKPLPSMPSIPEISPTELFELMASDSPPLLLDVREPDEYEAANLGGTLIPLGELPDRLDEIEGHKSDERIVVHCRSGGRSGQAVQMMHASGFSNAVNLRGGLHAWADEVDPSVPKV